MGISVIGGGFTVPGVNRRSTIGGSFLGDIGLFGTLPDFRSSYLSPFPERRSVLVNPPKIITHDNITIKLYIIYYIVFYILKV